MTGESDNTAAPPVCAVTGLSRSYAAASRPAVDTVSFAVGPGEVFGVLGRNGAGKTTLIRMLVGLLRPDGGGRVVIDGEEVTANAARAAARVAYLPQRESALSDMTVRTAVQTTARLRGLSRERARTQGEEILAELCLSDLAAARIDRLSGGQRRLVGVATALVGDPRLLVLDEPTTGLDVDARRAVWYALERRRTQPGLSVVLVTHDVREAESIVDRVLILHAGRPVACDTPGRLKEPFDGLVRLDLTWRDDPPHPPLDPRRLGDRVLRRGRRWSVRLPAEQAQQALDEVLSGPAYAALDDFKLAPPSLEDVLLACDAEAEE